MSNREFVELTWLLIRLGFPAYFLSRLVQGVYCLKYAKFDLGQTSILLLLSQFSSLIYTVLWSRFWLFKFEQMAGKIFWPAVFSEIGILGWTIIYYRKKTKT
ncbi:hypothetical protein BC343_09555 [Mucilaginibacter pedocola]|uniref:Uncharacterized protein n=1 Tax=Mucilaginibacter pedocola TaxID=1792845 RepID=A0A1S9PD80_9SPHI|nr:hypothetical protein BC343_09555 [Mucilaginibacter pedocola]